MAEFRHPGSELSRPEEEPLKYLILIYSNAKSRAVWEAMTEAQRMDFGRSHYALSDDLAASGELVVSEGLADPSLAKRVMVRDGQTMTSDGPFAEAKEYLAGFYLVESDSIERVIEHAARLPDAAINEVEVRPVFDHSVLDL
jgi:hypothetical protein